MHRSKEYLYSITLSAHEHRADSSSILCIEPCVDDFLCLGNNRFFGGAKGGGTPASKAVL